MKKKLLVINALRKQYYKDCHILGSINVSLDDLGAYAQKLDKSTPIVVYCASYSCPVSRKAWHILNDLGFANVRAYEGGIIEWFKLGYPVEGPCTSELRGLECTRWMLGR